jgi:two-component system, cell cycle response regulator DivK
VVAIGSRMLVLYVEDNEANFTLVRKVLESAGVTVVGAASGEEGLEAARARRPDVILLDLDLPGISGLTVAERLRHDPALADVPIVAISASVMKQERQQALDAGCVAFIEKPFDLQHLRRVVQRVAQGLDPAESGG